MPDLPKAMIIDDDEDLCEILSDFLEDDYECQMFQNPLEAMDAMKASKFDLIVTDLHMPEASGIEVVVAAQAAQPDTLVIISTGNSEADPLVQEALQSGARGVVTKPFGSPEKILEYLKQFS